MKNFQHVNQSFWTRGSSIPGVISLLAGTGVLLSPLFGVEASLKIWLVGGITVILGLLILSTFSGVEIDFDKKRFKKFDQIAGWKFGQWEDLSGVNRLDVIQHEYRSSNIPNGVSPTLSGIVLVHKLVFLSPDHVILELDHSSSQKAAESLEKIKKGLGLLV